MRFPSHTTKVPGGTENPKYAVLMESGAGNVSDPEKWKPPDVSDVQEYS